MEALGDDYDSEAAKDAERLKLGRRKGSTNKKNVESRRKYACSVTQAGVASEYDNLPSVTYPEIALCGRSNCGKSSLLNALCGMAPDNGVASVSSRPGWTQNFQLFTCTLRDDPDPFMSLLDIPGYGPAHAPQVQRTAWAKAMQGYLKRRDQLTCVFVLIDLSRGVLPEDRRFMAHLDERGRPFHVVLTKADCLTPLQLAQSHTLISRDIDAVGYAQMAKGDLPMTSAKHHQGITELWGRLAMGVVDIHEQRDEQAERDEYEAGDDEAGEAEAGERAAAGAADRTVRDRRRRGVGGVYESTAAAAKRSRVAQRAARKLRGESTQRVPGKGTCAESDSESKAKPVRRTRRRRDGGVASSSA
jgi:GTP-binding protein